MRFAKMQAAGNDFILIEGAGLERDWPCLAMAMCHRHFGVGADGLILLLPSAVADLRMRLFNPDGSEAEACGNGLRCVARYAIEGGLATVSRGELTVETPSGIRRVQIDSREGRAPVYRVDMGAPRFKAKEIPMIVEPGEGRPLLDIICDYPVEVSERRLLVTCLSLGNPHAVTFLEEPVEAFPLFELGPLVENHPIFPNRVNFEVANVLAREKVRARVWERGVGETLSCGTGACAIAVAARLHGHVGGHVDIILPGGTLTVDWDGVGEVMLSGPAELVFWGHWPD